MPSLVMEGSEQLIYSVKTEPADSVNEGLNLECSDDVGPSDETDNAASTLELDDYRIERTCGESDSVNLESGGNGPPCAIKDEPLDHVEDEECEFTSEPHDHIEPLLCDYNSSEQNDIPVELVKTEPCDQTEPCDLTLSSPPDPGNFGGSNSDNLSTNTEYADLMESSAHDKSDTARTVTSEPLNEQSQFPSDSDMSQVVSIKPEPADDDEDEHYEIRRADSDVSETMELGDEDVPFDSGRPPPGQLPIHVDDPLHGNQMQTEEDAGLTVTGVVANIHAKDSDHAVLEQAAGQSTAPYPVNLIQKAGEETAISDGSNEGERNQASASKEPEGQHQMETMLGMLGRLPPYSLYHRLGLTSAQAALGNPYPSLDKEGRATKCKFCGVEFTNGFERAAHERTHSEEKPFKCQHCDKCYRQKRHLIRHEMTHSGEKPFKCSHCDKTFTRPDSVMKHERIHTGEKPFSCQYCGMRFVQRVHLTIHERTHTGEKPFKCNFCEKRFAQKALVIEHERIHTGEKPFGCSYCEVRFAQKSNLRLHERTHTGERPFPCRFCEKRFTRKRLVVVHERLHTGEKIFGPLNKSGE